MKKRSLFLILLLGFAPAVFGSAKEKPKNCGCSCCEGEAVCCCNVAPSAKPKSDNAAIRATLINRFDRPDAPLAVASIVVEANYAIASWTQDHVGGRALLRRDGQDWVALLCAGKALKDIKTLGDAGVSQSSATVLVEKLTKAEAGLPSAQRDKYDAFQGIISLKDN